MIVSLVAVGFSFIFWKSGPNTDRMVLFTVFLTVFDFASDIAFITDLSTSQARYGDQFRASIAFSVINYVYNFSCTLHLYIRTVNEVPQMRAWVLNGGNRWSLTLVLGMLVGINPDCVQLTKSGLLGMSAFRAPWDVTPTKDADNSPRLTEFQLRGIPSILLKDVPKLAIKASVLAQKNNFTITVFLFFVPL